MNVRPTFWQNTLQAFEGKRVLLKVRGDQVRYLGHLDEIGPTSVRLRGPDGSTIPIEYVNLLECTEHKETDQ